MRGRFGAATARLREALTTRLSAVSASLVGMQFHVRPFRNMKGTIALDASALTDDACIVGHILAKGHARTSDASMIAGYVGRIEKPDEALCRFACAYADQSEADLGRKSE